MSSYNEKKVLNSDLSQLSLTSVWSRNDNSRASTISLLESKYDIPYLPKKKNKNQILDNQERETKRLEFLCAKNAENVSIGSSRLSFDMAMATVPKLILRNAKQLKIYEEVLKPFKENQLLAQYMIDKYVTKDKHKIEQIINNVNKNNEDDNDVNNEDENNNATTVFVTTNTEEDALEAEFRYLEMERKKIEKLVKQRIKKEKMAERLLLLQERSEYRGLDESNNSDNLDESNNFDEQDEDNEQDEDDENENNIENNNYNELDKDPNIELIIGADNEPSTIIKTEKDFNTKHEYILYRKQLYLSVKEENLYKGLVLKQKEIEERLLKLKQKFGEKARERFKKWVGLIYYFKYLSKISKRYRIVSEREKIRLKYSRALGCIMRTYRKYKDRKWKRENNIADIYEGTLFDKYKNDIELRTKAKAILNARMDALSLISSFIRLLDKSLKHAIIKFLQRIRTFQYYVRWHRLGTEGRYIGFNHIFDIFFHRLQMMIFVHIEGSDVYINSEKKKLLTKMRSHLASPSKKQLIKEMKTQIFFEKLKHKLEGQDMSMILTLGFKFSEIIKRKYFLDYIFETRRNYVHKIEQDAKRKISIETVTTDEVKMWIKNKRDDPLEERLNEYLDLAEQGLGQENSTVKIKPYISFFKNINASTLLELFFSMFEEQRAIYKAEEILLKANGNNSKNQNLLKSKQFALQAKSFMSGSFNDDITLHEKPTKPISINSSFSNNSPRKTFIKEMTEK